MTHAYSETTLSDNITLPNGLEILTYNLLLWALIIAALGVAL